MMQQPLQLMAILTKGISNVYMTAFLIDFSHYVKSLLIDTKDIGGGEDISEVAAIIKSR